MSVDKFNSVGGYSVGIPPMDIIDETGNITANSVNADVINVTTNVSAPVFYGDLVGNVYGATSTRAAAVVQPAAPATPVDGTMWYDTTTSQLKIYSSAMGWMAISSNQSIPVTEHYNFAESMRWVVVHNKNTTRFREYLMDATGSRFYAGLNILDSNSFEVLLTVATAGTVDVVFD